MDRLSLKAYAKLNLYLNILNKREDGYHNLETIFERISLYDIVELSKSEAEGISLTCSDQTLENKDNLCYIAAELFFKQTGVVNNVAIHIEKHIPKGGGLGGASSDAASVLMGLNELFDAGLSKQELYMMGAQIGSDVNFFISEEKFALGSCRGEVIEPIKSDKVFNHILLLGHEEISTATIYKLYKPQLTKYSDGARLFVRYLQSNEENLPIDFLYNALTNSYLEVSKKARQIFDELNLADETFLLSGSGATINVMAPDKDYDLDDSLKFRLKEWGIRLLSVTSH